MATRWGIAGCGLISSDFTKSVNLLPKSDHQIVAVAARDITRAKAFAEKFNVPKAYGSYDELAKDSDIDVVYIGVIPKFHLGLITLMVEAGKHILCETPMCFNVAQMLQAQQLAKSKNLFIMQAYWSKFLPSYDKICKSLSDGAIGEPRLLQCEIGFPEPDMMKDAELGRSIVAELGSYTIHLSQLVFREKPDKVIASGILSKAGLDQSAILVLMYSGNRMAVLTMSATHKLTQRAIIEGTNGIIMIPDKYWAPTEIIINGESTKFPLGDESTDYSYPNGSEMRYEAQHVRQCLQQGLLESPLLSHESCLTVAEIVADALKQVGVVART